MSPFWTSPMKFLLPGLNVDGKRKIYWQFAKIVKNLDLRISGTLENES